MVGAPAVSVGLGQQYCVGNQNEDDQYDEAEKYAIDDAAGLTGFFPVAGRFFDFMVVACHKIMSLRFLKNWKCLCFIRGQGALAGLLL